jgi:hypothetical protein
MLMTRPPRRPPQRWRYKMSRNGSPRKREELKRKHRGAMVIFGAKKPGTDAERPT